MKKFWSIAVLAMTAAVLFGCGEEKGETVVFADKGEEVTYAPITDAEIASLPLVGEEDLSKYIELGDYKGLPVSTAIEQPTEEEIQEMIDNNMETLTDLVPVTGRPVQEGDTVNIDYVGKKDGVAFDGGSAQGFDLEIGSGRFIEGFEDGLIGANVGDTVSLGLTFPEQYHNAELAGQAVVFTVTINEIKEKTVPELNDEVANGLNPECKTVAEYKEAIKQSIIETKKQTAVQAAHNELMETATANAAIKELPEWLMRVRMQSMRANLESYAAANGVDYADFVQMAMQCSVDEFEKQAAEYAEADAKQCLVAYAIAKKEGLLMSEAELTNEMSDYLASIGSTDDAKAFLHSMDGRSYSDYLQMQKVTDWLYDNAKVTE